MRKQLSIVVLCLVSANSWAGAALTDIETRWLNAGSPVLDYAEEQGLPIDIIVQPVSKPGDVPLAMGFDNGRCKLVLSMRGNPDAQSMVANLAPTQVDVVIEAITAHEVAHCWRSMEGAGQTPPAGFVTGGPNRDWQKAQMRQQMQATRREEGLADLVGLAWTLHRHPQQYGQVHAWFEKIRQDQPVAGNHHDTRAWIRLAEDPSAFEDAETLFEQARVLWTKGLRSEELSLAWHQAN